MIYFYIFWINSKNMRKRKNKKISETFIDKFINVLKEKFPEINVKNCSDNFTSINLQKYIANSCRDKKFLGLVERNNHTEWYFTHISLNNDKEKKLLLIYNGLISATTNDINVALNMNLRMNQSFEKTCKICNAEYRFDSKTKSYNTRSCNNCSTSFCIKCQILTTLSSVKNHNFSLVCPFCRHEHSLGIDGNDLREKHIYFAKMFSHRLFNISHNDLSDSELREVTDYVNRTKNLCFLSYFLFESDDLIDA